MRIPAIDELMNHIPDARTEESMKEVLSCFYSGNLRSAVVMLYATVVSDIYYKLSELVAVYSDVGAIQIKEYVDKEWHEHPKSPAWETEMPRKCREKNGVQEAMKWVAEALGFIVQSVLKVVEAFSKWKLWIVVPVYAFVAAIRAARLSIIDFNRAQQTTIALSLGTKLKNTLEYWKLWGKTLLSSFNLIKVSNDELDVMRNRMEALKTVSLGWISVIAIAITAFVQYIAKENEAEAARNRAIGEYNATISQNIAQADAMFDALERTIDPLQKAREEHEKTVAALDQITEANKNGKASYEEVTQAEEANRQAKERLNEASNDQARALNAVNSAYGNTIRLSQVDLNNAALLEAAHKRVAAAIRDEAAARMGAKLRENVTNKHADKIAEVEGSVTNEGKLVRDGHNQVDSRKNAELIRYAKEQARMLVDKARREGLSVDSYKKELNKLIDKKYKEIFGISHNQQYTKYKDSNRESVVDRKGLRDTSGLGDLKSAMKDYMKEYSEYESALSDVESTIQSEASVNDKLSTRDKAESMRGYKSVWNSIKAKASKYASDIKGTSGQEFSDAIHVLEEYTKTYKELSKKSPSSISEQDRKDFEAYSEKLKELRAAYQEKLATEIWAKPKNSKNPKEVN